MKPNPQAAAQVAKARHADAQRHIGRADALLRAVDEQRKASYLEPIGRSFAEDQAIRSTGRRLVMKAAGNLDELPSGVIDLLNQISQLVNGQDELPDGTLDLLNQLVTVMNAVDASQTANTGANQAAESPVDTGEGAAVAKSARRAGEPMYLATLKEQYARRPRR